MDCEKCEFVEETYFPFGDSHYRNILYCNKYFSLCNIAKKECNIENKNLKKTIYFAHPHDRRFSKRKDMIIKKLKNRGFEVIDPFTGEDNVAKKYGVKDYYENPCRKFALEIKERDFSAVIECDALFAWIPKEVTVIGTIREFDKALEKNKYTIVLCYKPNPFLEDADELYLSYQDFFEERQFEWK